MCPNVTFKHCAEVVTCQVCFLGLELLFRHVEEDTVSVLSQSDVRVCGESKLVEELFLCLGCSGSGWLEEFVVYGLFMAFYRHRPFPPLPLLEYE